MNKKLVLLGTALLLSAASVSAQKRVTGRVLDQSGEPVVGASVRVEGGKGVAVTDANGQFTLQDVSASAKSLKVSYIGKTAKTVSIASNVRVVLEDAENAFDEAIVVGYGKVKKGDFTGSVSAMKSEELKKLQVSNVSRALEGTIPGVQITQGTGQPGASAKNILVRGIGSISANSNPLIIVDGAPYEGSLNTINPADIESMNLQKDASATSIYGARGSNGILYITTKKGAPGKTHVSVDAKWGWNSRGVDPYETVESEADFYELMWEAIYNRQRNAKGMTELQARQFASQNLVKELGGYNTFNVPDGALINPLTGRINPAGQLLWHDDWQEEPFENGLRQEYNVALSGGNDQTSYYMSVNYLNDKSYVKYSDFDRVTGRVSIDHKAFSWLTVGANVNYARTETNALSAEDGKAANLFIFSNLIAPIYPVYRRDSEGNLVYDKNGEKQLDLGNMDGRQRKYGLNQNPLVNVFNNNNESITDAISIRGYADVKLPLKGLTFHADLAMDNFATNWSAFTSPITADAKNSNGYGEKESSRTHVINATQRLNYANTFGKHSISLMAAHESKSEESKGLGAYRKQFFLPENNFSYSLIDLADPVSSDNGYHLESYLGRAEYSYNHLYSVSATFRADGSSVFDPDHRWGNFWSVGAAWNFGSESFVKAVAGSWLSNGKLKVSYGTQGNDYLLTASGARMYAPYLDQYAVMNAGTAEDPVFSIVQTHRGNRDITWEKSKTFNVGIEAGFFQRRLSVEFDYFIKDTEDMLGQHTLPGSMGDPSYYYTNEQAMRNKGFEVLINGTMIQTKNIKWTASLNLTHYKNELTRTQKGRPAEGYQSGDYWRMKGGSLYDWYMARYAGVDPETGDALYYRDITEVDPESGKEVTKTVTTNDGSLATKYQIGKSALPDVYGGFNMGIEAYGFDLSVQTAFSIGGYTYDGTYATLMNCTIGNTFHKDMFKRWQKPGDVTDVPRLEEGYRMTGGTTNDRFLTKSSYFSLRNVTLGYTLPESITSYVPGLSSVRIYAVGDNLFLGTKRVGLDPRYSIAGGTSSGRYSALRTISFGVNVNF